MKTQDYLSKYVSFLIGRKKFIGYVSSIEQNVANIRGIEQTKKERPAYHINVSELKILTQLEAFNLGRTLCLTH